MKHGVIAGFCVALVAATQVNADCIRDRYGKVVCGAGQCEKDQYGKVYCARAGGGALRDRYGQVKCGTGYCARDREGEVWCSREPGGGAAVDTYGEVKCLGGCELGAMALCEEGR